MWNGLSCVRRGKREWGDEGVIALTLNRGGEHWRIQLQLPSDPIEIEEAFAALDRISLDIGSTVIVDVDSNVQGLYGCLIDLDIMEPENFQKLQQLAGYTEGLSSTKEKLFSGVLSAPVIKCKKPPRKKCSFVAEEAKNGAGESVV